MVKNPLTNAEDIRDADSIPGLGRSPGEEIATHSSILAWKILWTRAAWQVTSPRVTKSRT